MKLGVTRFASYALLCMTRDETKGVTQTRKGVILTRILARILARIIARISARITSRILARILARISSRMLARIVAKTLVRILVPILARILARIRATLLCFSRSIYYISGLKTSTASCNPLTVFQNRVSHVCPL